MSTNAILAPKNLFKLGWGILTVSAALMTLGHLSMIFILNERTLFIGHTAFNFLAFLIILIPLRQGRKWAWISTWILPVVLAVTAAFVPEIVPYYLGVAAVCVLGLLLTMRDFFSKSKSIPVA